MTEGRKMIEEIHSLLKEEQFNIKLLDHATACKLNYTFKNVDYQCFFGVNYDQSMIVFYFLPTFTISDNYLKNIGELVARINYNTILGNFELDFFSGRARFKKILQWREKTIEINEIKSALEHGFTVWDTHTPLFQAVLNEEVLPEDAIKML
jgi:hypothetical protein